LSFIKKRISKKESNYQHFPILPLAIYNTNANVTYNSSVYKTIASVFRSGWLIAPK
jgi:GntR family transcriptional regulator/MocR family aminotransferase